MANLIKTAGDFIQAYDQKDWDCMRSYVTDDIGYDEKGTERQLEGWGAVMEALQGWGKSFPDSIGKITNAFHSGDQVTLEVIWQGTHTAPLLVPADKADKAGKALKTIAASNRRVDVPAAIVFSFVGEKIKAVRHYFNLTTMLRQIGAT